MSQRIVCAVIREVETNTLIIGLRHFDALMQSHQYFDNETIQWEQGFLDNNYNFLTRRQAWKVAEKAGQIIHRVGGNTKDGGTLFSENLY